MTVITPGLKHQMILNSLEISRNNFIDKIRRLNIELKQIESNLYLVEDIILKLKNENDEGVAKC